jgi:hypothetical protein
MSTDTLELEIAATAARLVVDEGLEYGPAKRRAVQQLGLPQRSRLPDNDVLEAAVREHLAVFCGDTQPGELAALRSLALVWMGRLQAFRPHLTGAVWNGTATRLSDVWLQLFCDDPKSAEIELINRGVRYDVGTTTGFTGRTVEVLSVSARCPELNEDVGVHLVLYDVDDLRGALRPDGQGRKGRGDAVAVRALLDAASVDGGARP